MHQLFPDRLIGAHGEGQSPLKSGETTGSLDDPMPKGKKILFPTRNNNLGIEVKIAAARFTGRIFLFLFFAKRNLSAEASRAPQFEDEFSNFAPLSACQFHTASYRFSVF
jgi:hypothetical protein